MRTVFEHAGEHASQWAAISSIAAKIGCNPETLRGWIRQAERDQGKGPGPATDEQQRIKALERGNARGARCGTLHGGPADAAHGPEGGGRAERRGLAVQAGQRRPALLVQRRPTVGEQPIDLSAGRFDQGGTLGLRLGAPRS